MDNQDPIAERKAEKLRKRHNIETLAQEHGQKRAAYADDLASETQFIANELLPKAIEAGIPLDTFAKLAGVSRQTLYRWREAIGRMA